MELLIGHSPDPDDAYMFYALTAGKVSFPFKIREFLVDIETLNRLALHGRLDVTAISTHALAYVADKYYVLRVGASMGLKYGPVVVGKGSEVKLVAVPGTYATATLLFKLAMPNVKAVEVPFDKIMDAVISGAVDAGVLIHEGQITYDRYGLRSIMDLGEWWYEQTKLPTPLGLDVVKASLGMDNARLIRDALLESLRYAMRHREEALEYAMKFSRGLNMSDTGRFVDMYVNNYTVDMGNEGEKAIRTLLQWGHEEGLLPEVNFTIV
ncbi:menaquinone biosynthesis family protein [Caldivirga sp. UBA161]|uniref:menaquinone biosynthesis family protein n=1 Tax=Caldivirga sp. UBA161 TaxID=1915569 RepID=UPI0025C215F1|nr:MqnA/MqnD/SBP family protein [Caldivirga sp. UBA161]